jgi:very-short-patch-repair endonuclease
MGGNVVASMNNQTFKARELRKNLTDYERRLWRELRLRQLRGLKFRRQFPIGPYIVDFACPEKKIIVEVDGGQHVENKEYDEMRTQWLQEQGFRVLRFWNNEVQNNLDEVKQTIYRALFDPPAPALPHKGGGSSNGYRPRPGQLNAVGPSPLVGEGTDGGKNV